MRRATDVELCLRGQKWRDDPNAFNDQASLIHEAQPMPNEVLVICLVFISAINENHTPKYIPWLFPRVTRVLILVITRCKIGHKETRFQPITTLGMDFIESRALQTLYSRTHIKGPLKFFIHNSDEFVLEERKLCRHVSDRSNGSMTNMLSRCTPIIPKSIFRLKHLQQTRLVL